jgi:hypothetical protein
VSNLPIEQPEKPATSGPGYLEVIVIALLVAVIALVGYDRLFAQKIKVLDLKGYLRTQKALLAAGEITTEQWKGKLDTVEQILNDEAARHRNHVIVLKDVVLRNGDEIRIND